MTMFQKILVANRGEIALRVIRACHDLNIEAVAVYSEADRGAPWLDFADQTICIGPAVSAESYLKIPRIIAAAEVSGAQAIHPGYGFLSENSKFAEQCRESGIEFIGPSVAAMDALGNKDKSKTVARAAKVPTVPGSDGLITSVEQARKFADRVEYPVLVKASAGGGGRGMRVVRTPDKLEDAINEARQEAEGAFKDGSLFLEKYLDRPRHVEVQLLGDQHGNVLHLYERDCSLQRKHQKLVEESPSPHLPEKVRVEMCAAAVRLAKEAGYYNAGTCEFLVDQKNNYYFIEVNARVQVEHPVTELVTGVDVIREQIRVAAGEKLRYAQKDIQQRGCAMEVRINAEDPANDFRGSPGVVKTWRPPGGPGVRLDSLVCAGYRVPSNYDSMVAKLLVHQPTRAEAFAVMRRALREFIVEGIHTTIPILKTIFDTPAFIEGKVDTTFIERELMPAKA
jgi:acetyl-CoA carboxylase biotin carboxylase subunit